MTVTATAIGGDDNGCNSDGRGHRQQSTKIGSKDTVAVTAMETAAAGAATIAAARQQLPWALAQMELPLTPPGRVVGAGCDGCVWVLCKLVVCVLRAPVVLLEAHTHKCIKNLANHGTLGISGKLLTRQAKLLHLIRANL